MGVLHPNSPSNLEFDYVKELLGPLSCGGHGKQLEIS
jgi:hypothetical protein